MYATCLALSLALSFAQSSPDSSDVQRELRVYDLHFLTKEVPDLPLPEAGAERNLSLLERAEQETYGFDPDWLEEPGSLGGLALTPEAIMELVRRNIAEDSWANEKNSIAARGGELVVIQTPEVHEEIADLLAHLRARRARRFEIEVIVLSEEAPVESLLRGPPNPAPEALAAVLDESAEKAHRILLTAYEQQTVSTLSGRRRATITDTEVNQTGVIPVANPIVHVLPLGVSLEAKALPVAGTDRVQVELRVRRLLEAGEVRRRKTTFAELESVPLREESLRTALLVEPGEPALAGSFREAADNGETSQFAVIVRVSRKDPGGAVDVPFEPRPEGAETFVLRVYDVGFLLGGADTGSPQRKLLVPLLRMNVEPEAWKDARAGATLERDGLYVTARPETHAKISSWIESLTRRRARLASVRLEVFEAPLESVLALEKAARGGWLLPEQWGKIADGARGVLESTTRGLAGEEMHARMFSSSTFVSDVETVSGGTGFSIIEMPDPVVASAGDGFTLRATVEGHLDPRRLLLRLDLHRSRTRFLRRAEFTAPARARSRSGPPEEISVRLPYVIDLPEEESFHCRTAFAVPRGLSVLLEVQRTRGKTARFVVATATVEGEVDATGADDTEGEGTSP